MYKIFFQWIWNHTYKTNPPFSKIYLYCRYLNVPAYIKSQIISFYRSLRLNTLTRNLCWWIWTTNIITTQEREVCLEFVIQRRGHQLTWVSLFMDSYVFCELYKILNAKICVLSCKIPLSEFLFAAETPFIFIFDDASTLSSNLENRDILPLEKRNVR